MLWTLQGPETYDTTTMEAKSPPNHGQLETCFASWDICKHTANMTSTDNECQI